MYACTLTKLNIYTFISYNIRLKTKTPSKQKATSNQKKYIHKLLNRKVIQRRIHPWYSISTATPKYNSPDSSGQEQLLVILESPQDRLTQEEVGEEATSKDSKHCGKPVCQRVFAREGEGACESEGLLDIPQIKAMGRYFYN